MSFEGAGVDADCWEGAATFPQNPTYMANVPRLRMTGATLGVGYTRVGEPHASCPHCRVDGRL